MDCRRGVPKDNSATRIGTSALVIFMGEWGGHSGAIITLQNVSSLLYWKGLKRYVKIFIRSRKFYQKKYNYLVHSRLLQSLPILQAMFIDISLDYIIRLHKFQGKEFIFVVAELLTKYAYFMALSHPYDTTNISQTFIDHVYRLQSIWSVIEICFFISLL